MDTGVQSPNLPRATTSESLLVNSPAGTARQTVQDLAMQLVASEPMRLATMIGNLYDAAADLPATTAQVTPWVWNDPDPDKIGIYKVSGGEWVRALPLPYSVLQATVDDGDTVNARRLRTSLPLYNGVVVVLPIIGTNTASPVTVSFDGGATTRTLKTNSGGDIAVGGSLAGMLVLVVVVNETLRLVTDQSGAVIMASLEAAVAAAIEADASAGTATGAAGVATAAATAAGEAADRAETAAATVEGTVSYAVEQDLTTEEKARAQTNLGVDILLSSKVPLSDTEAPSIDFTFPWGAAEAKTGRYWASAFAADGAKPIIGRYEGHTTSIGAGTVPYQVGAFFSLDGLVGAGNLYALNTVVQHVNAGQSFTSIEANTNNNTGSYYGESIDPTTADIYSGNPWATGINVAVTGTARVTAGIAVSAPPAFGQIYNRGVAVFGDTVRIADFEAAAHALYGFRASGAHVHAISTQWDTSTVALQIANSQSIRSITTGGDEKALVALLSDNVIHISQDGVDVAFGGRPSPTSDDTLDLGTSGVRWKTIYLVNSPSVTSDPSQKDILGELPYEDASALLDALAPIVWKWKIGGNETVEEEIDGMIPATRKVSRDREEIYVDGDGVGRVRTVIDEIEEIITEDIPVLDADGNPVMRVPQGDLPGEDLHPVPVVVTRQKMVPGKVKVRHVESRPGRRTHVGWDASQVSEALGNIGADLGIVCRDDDGTLSLRESRMAAVLWAVVRRQAAEIAEMQQRLAALETAT